MLGAAPGRPARSAGRRRSRGGDRQHHAPHTAIDTEAHWTRSGWHGWVDGSTLHLVVTVAAVWIPLAADLPDNEVAPRLLPELRFLLGDPNYDVLPLREQCAASGLALVTSNHGRYP